MNDSKTDIIRGYHEDIMEDRQSVSALQHIRRKIEADDRISETDANQLIRVINEVIDGLWETFSS